MRRRINERVLRELCQELFPTDERKRKIAFNRNAKKLKYDSVTLWTDGINVVGEYIPLPFPLSSDETKRKIAELISNPPDNVKKLCKALGLWATIDISLLSFGRYWIFINPEVVKKRTGGELPPEEFFYKYEEPQYPPAQCKEIEGFDE